MSTLGLRIIRAAAELTEFAITSSSAPIEEFVANAERVYERHGLSDAKDREAASTLSGLSVEFLTRYMAVQYARSIDDHLPGWSRGSDAVN